DETHSPVAQRFINERFRLLCVDSAVFEAFGQDEMDAHRPGVRPAHARRSLNPAVAERGIDVSVTFRCRAYLLYERRGLRGRRRMLIVIISRLISRERCAAAQRDR